MRRLFLLVASLLLTIAVGEVGLRLRRPIEYRLPPGRVEATPWRTVIHRPSSVPGLSYELKPFATGTLREAQIRINSWGMRDDEPLPQTADLTRIMVVGDSMTFGFRVPTAAQTFCGQLEQMLHQGSPGSLRWEVLNLGVGGYSVTQEAALIAARAPQLHPDLLVVAYFLNDPEIVPIYALASHFAPVRPWQRSELLRLAASVAHKAQVRRWGRGRGYYEYLHREPRRWASVVEAFASIRESAAREDVPVLLAILPAVPRASPDQENWSSSYHYVDVHRRVGEEARKQGFRVLDLHPGLAQHSPQLLRASPGDDHLSVAGHRLVAELLLPAVLDMASDGL